MLLLIIYWFSFIYLIIADIAIAIYCHYYWCRFSCFFRCHAMPMLTCCFDVDGDMPCWWLPRHVAIDISFSCHMLWYAIIDDAILLHVAIDAIDYFFVSMMLITLIFTYAAADAIADFHPIATIFTPCCISFRWCIRLSVVCHIYWWYFRLLSLLLSLFWWLYFRHWCHYCFDDISFLSSFLSFDYAAFDSCFDAITISPSLLIFLCFSLPMIAEAIISMMMPFSIFISSSMFSPMLPLITLSFIFAIDADFRFDYAAAVFFHFSHLMFSFDTMGHAWCWWYLRWFLRRYAAMLWYAFIDFFTRWLRWFSFFAAITDAWWWHCWCRHYAADDTKCQMLIPTNAIWWFHYFIRCHDDADISWLFSPRLRLLAFCRHFSDDDLMSSNVVVTSLPLFIIYFIIIETLLLYYYYIYIIPLIALIRLFRRFLFALLMPGHTPPAISMRRLMPRLIDDITPMMILFISIIIDATLFADAIAISRFDFSISFLSLLSFLIRWCSILIDWLISFFATAGLIDYFAGCHEYSELEGRWRCLPCIDLLRLNIDTPWCMLMIRRYLRQPFIIDVVTIFHYFRWWYLRHDISLSFDYFHISPFLIIDAFDSHWWFCCIHYLYLYWCH